MLDPSGLLVGSLMPPPHSQALHHAGSSGRISLLSALQSGKLQNASSQNLLAMYGLTTRGGDQVRAGHVQPGGRGGDQVRAGHVWPGGQGGGPGACGVAGCVAGCEYGVAARGGGRILRPYNRKPRTLIPPPPPPLALKPTMLSLPPPTLPSSLPLPPRTEP